MLTTLALATISLSSPLVWEARVEPTRYRKGIGYRVELFARNVSARPVVLAQAIYDGGPAAHVEVNLTRDGQKVEPYGESSMPIVQVMMHRNIDANRFITIAPGQRAMVYWKRIEGRWDFKGATTRLKADYARAQQVKLEKSTYRAELTYTFTDPKAGPRYGGTTSGTATFGPGAKALWEAAFRGKGSASVRFTVR